MDFLQKPLAGFSNFYLGVQSKNSGRNNFFILLFRVFFAFWAKISSEFWPKNFKKFSKIPSKCPEEQFVAWNLFIKIWIVLDFLLKTLQWFSDSIFVPRVKNREEINCLSFSSVFLDFERKKISDFWPKNFKKLSKLTSVLADEQFLAWNFFQMFWTVLNFLRKPLAWLSKFYLRVQSKISEETVSLTFLFRTFSNFERNIFRLLAKQNFKKLSKLPSKCPEEQFVAWIFF